jgi:protein-S-isoprenylcysteine O-methyltransferase Ste14
MRASALEFRLRMAIMAVIIGVGFWSPWIEAWGIGRRISLLEWLALEVSRLDIVRFTVATPLVIVLGALVAAVGAALRIWGTAYLGPGIVNGLSMKASAVVAGGPYRFVRNPLYLGSAFTVAAMSFIMPPTGAVFAMVVLCLFLMRLILGEEIFLALQLGKPYRTYLRTVPRLVPRLRTSLPAGSDRPQWLQAVLAELLSIGVFVTLAFLSWRYDNLLMLRAILVSFGISLVVRALMPRTRQEADVAT